MPVRAGQTDDRWRPEAIHLSLPPGASHRVLSRVESDSRRWGRSRAPSGESAILFRATTNMGLYIDALDEHGIPVYVIQGTYFYRKSEVSDLIALLELIIRPADPLLRATVLTSSLAGMTFKDLVEGRASEALHAILKRRIEMRDRTTAAEL